MAILLQCIHGCTDTHATVKIIENNSHILKLSLDTRPREDLCYEFNYHVLELPPRILSCHDRD